MADTPLPMAPNTCWRRWGEIARKTAPRLNIENVRNIIAIPLSAFARRTAATKALNWYRYQGLTAYWKVESRNLAASEERGRRPDPVDGLEYQPPPPQHGATGQDGGAKFATVLGFAESTTLRLAVPVCAPEGVAWKADRKSTRLNSSHA